MRITSTTLIAAAALLLGACSDKTSDGSKAAGAVDTMSALSPAATMRSPSPSSLDSAIASRTTPARPAVPAPASPARARSDSTARRPAAPRHLVFNGVDITDIGYDHGNANAPVTVVDFSDFACPYCGEFARETYPVIERDYVRTGKVRFKYVPFLAGFPHGREATRAAECAAEQGKFWQMYEHVYATQAEWRRGNGVDAQMAALAATISADSAKFAGCYRDGHTDARTARATGFANELGVRVTPSFLVNDRPVQGALPLAEFRKVIDAALLLAGIPR
ncbi:MAG: DsbA family protein [Gemmatimonadaceae bacterium]